VATQKECDTWGVTDEFWARVEPFIPVRQRTADKTYLRQAGAGRPGKPPRQVFEAILYVLRTGCQWKALPKDRFGSASAVHKRFLEWEASGVFDAIWRAGLAESDQMEGISWRWQSVEDAKSTTPGELGFMILPQTSREPFKDHTSASGRRSWHPVVVRRKRSGPA